MFHHLIVSLEDAVLVIMDIILLHYHLLLMILFSIDNINIVIILLYKHVINAHNIANTAIQAYIALNVIQIIICTRFLNIIYNNINF